jgi:hypothetical protein
MRVYRFPTFLLIIAKLTARCKRQSPISDETFYSQRMCGKIKFKVTDEGET